MGVKKYAQEVVKEGKRVRWPKKDVFLPALITCIVICVFCALILVLEDLAGGSLVNALRNMFQGDKPASSEVADAAARLFIK